jgi:uncharacterized iron-regulated membrane protein
VKSPRGSVSSDHGGWFINQDGSLGEVTKHDWTHLLTDLHLYLHLPESFGMIVVSLLGAMLCGLIVSGFLSHPRIFKDAFSLRVGGSARLEQADIHNRLSVWGAPFHLMIAITGAFFGLALLVSVVMVKAFYNGDQKALMAAVYGAEPELNQTRNEPADIAKVLQQMEAIAPGTIPFYVTVEDVGTPKEFFIVGAEHPQRLIYAEQYRFDGAGNYLDKVGFSDGITGSQVIFSIYRIHFGHFDGFAIKILYAILGLALTIVSVTGINIWLAKRKTRDAINNLWIGFVWGTPAALALSAITQVLFGIPSVLVLWGALVAAMALTQYLNNDARGRAWLQIASALLIGVLIIGYSVKFGEHAFNPVAAGVNIAFLFIAILLVMMVIRRRK